MERTVAARKPGDRPNDRPDPSLVKHRLPFEVRAETLAHAMSRQAKSRKHSRDLQAAVAKDLGGQGVQVDDDMLLYEIARRALGGPADEGRAGYQSLPPRKRGWQHTRCEACKQSAIDAGGESHAVDEAVAEMVACDSQELGHVDPSLDVDSNPHDDEGEDGAGSGSDHSLDVDSNPHVGASRPRRATQTIPPAIRRLVMRRDGGR